MSLYSESELIKTAIKQVVSESIKEETSSCFRVYKAIVVKTPYFDSTIGNACQVRLIGDPSVLTLPYSSATKNVQSGDVVWVATTSNSFRNAIVWDTRYFQNDYLQKPKHYGVRWNKTVAQMTRMYDAADITTDTSNFGHFGATNPNYNNPFDSIYPWSEIQLCNIDINAYLELQAGDSVKNCVVAWEGEPNFSYFHPNGVWRYRPSFYGKSWEDGAYRYFDIADTYVYGYNFYQESIIGRWHGVSVNKNINGTSKKCLIPTPGIPLVYTPGKTIHSYAKNYGATLDSIYSIDPEILLFIVEYATINSQSAIGLGCTKVYRQANDHFLQNSTGNVVQISTDASTYCINGAKFDIGTWNGGDTLGSYIIISSEIDPSDPSITLLTLNESVSVTTSNFWSVHGISNNADSQIGSMSGYLGISSQANTYYRGTVLFGNMHFYVLGAYFETSTNHIWIANSDEESDQYDGLDTSVHYDTGISVPESNGYIQSIASPINNLNFSVLPICQQIGGNNNNPVGDYFITGSASINTVLYYGGYGDGSYYNGIMAETWAIDENNSQWRYAGRPRLKNP